MRKQANRSRGGEALPGSILLNLISPLRAPTNAPITSASSTHMRTPMPFVEARCAHLTSCGNGIGVQMPRARAGNGYLFVTMSSNDPSLSNMVAAMSTIARFVLDVRENFLLGADPNKSTTHLRHTCASSYRVIATWRARCCCPFRQQMHLYLLVCRQSTQIDEFMQNPNISQINYNLR